MSVIDFITGLFRDPPGLRAFLDDPIKTLREAGFPDVTPEQVEGLLSLVAESMPHAGEKQLDIEELDMPPDKAIGPADTEDARLIVDTFKAGTWESADIADKSIGPVADDPLTPEFEEPVQEPDGPYSDHAVGGGDLVDPELSSAAWGKSIE
ncbi:IniB N-terminal domain-containing protein [Mycobacterium hubeiense]|uniref:IniB N-terminal domain-containing protein n=1 Tax=Mycobacterium hubeiense TaxID=1867256 RepID=UPI000C7F13D5|nr:IniB N-terminal domain-containing protein [Mycobacterium sp. QGD 101]